MIRAQHKEDSLLGTVRLPLGHPIPTTGLLLFRSQNAKSPTAMAGLSARNVKQKFGGA